MTMSANKLRSRSEDEALEYDMRLSKTMFHPYCRSQYYIPCTLQLCVPLWTCDAMQAQPGCNSVGEHIGSRKIVHDTMTSIRSIKCLANIKKSIQSTMASLGSWGSLGTHGPSSPLPRRR